MEIQQEVSQFLISYGFPTKMNGYHYLKEAIAYVAENDVMPSNKVLCSYLSDKFNADKCNVERCIRTLIDNMYDKLKDQEMFQSKPSTREFIMKCTECFLLKTTSAASSNSAYDILDEP